MNEEALKSINELLELANAIELPREHKIQELTKTEEPFHIYRAIDYFETGCGRKIYLQISLNNHNKEHYEQEWKSLVNYEYHLQGEERLTEREFLDRYTRLIPNMIVHLLREKSLTIWQQHFHFNRS